MSKHKQLNRHIRRLEDEAARHPHPGRGRLRLRGLGEAIAAHFGIAPPLPFELVLDTTVDDAGRVTFHSWEVMLGDDLVLHGVGRP